MRLMIIWTGARYLLIICGVLLLGPLLFLFAMLKLAGLLLWNTCKDRFD